MHLTPRRLLSTLVLAGATCWAVPPSAAQCPSAGDSPFHRALKPGLFVASLNGSVKLSWNGATSALPAVGGGLAVTFSSGSDSIFLVMPAGIAPGTYSIRDYRGAFDRTGNVTAAGAYFVHTQDRGKSKRYDTFRAGALKVLSANPLTGTITLDTRVDGKRLTAAAAFCELHVVQR